MYAVVFVYSFTLMKAWVVFQCTAAMIIHAEVFVQLQKFEKRMDLFT